MTLSVDTTPPPDPSITATQNANGTVTVTGATEPNAEVTVTFPDGTTKTVTADASGNYSATSDTSQPSGTIKAQAKDAAGNTSGTTSQAFTDTVAPSANVSASQNADGTVTATGTTEPGASVKVTFPDGTSKTVTADASGNYSATSDATQPTGTVTAAATDAAGNTSPVATTSVTDTVPPQGTTISASQNPDGTVTATGTTEPNAEVTVTFPDGTKKTVTADASGNYSATSDAAQSSGTVSATSKDAAGNVSDPVSQLVNDTVAPAAPTFDSVTQGSDGTVTVTGKAEPGSLVKVTFPDGSVKQVVADASGSFTVTSDTSQPSGDVVATATDAAGNESAPHTQSFTDTVAAPFEVTSVTQNNDGTVTVTGKAEPGATVNVTYPDGTTGTTTAGPDGNYTVTSATNQPSGDVTTTMTDKAGNSSAPVVTPFIDTVAPTAPFFTNVTQNDDGTVTVVGTAEPGATVKVTFPDGTIKEIEADSSGNFTVKSDTSQPTGTITGTATDKAGNTSGEVAQTLTDGVAPPAPSLITVTQNPDGTVSVTGKSEPGTKVTVTYPDGTTSTVTADANGDFATQSATSQPSGKVKATATDDAGNVSGETIRVFTDSVPPAAPVITNVTQANDGTVTVTGTAEPGTTTTVTFPDGTTKTVTVGDDGTFSVTSDGPQENGYVTATSTDAAGNTTAPVQASFDDAVAPNAPTFNTVTRNPDNSLTITGTAEPGSVVKITYPDGTQATVIADQNGNFTATSSSNQPGGNVVATATDAAGNTSGDSVQAVAGPAATVTPPVITSVVQNDDGTLTVSGTADPGAEVTVTFPDGTSKTVTAGPDGTFTVTSDTSQPNGEVKATAKNSDGDTSGETRRAFSDIEAPAVNTLQALQNNDGTVVASGTSEPGATVTVTWPDGTTSETVAGPDGSFRVTSPTVQPAGDVTAQASDDAGNTSPLARTTVVPHPDTTAPTVSVSGMPAEATAGAQHTLTFTFSEDVTGFDPSDIVLTNARVVGFTGSGDTYQVIIEIIDEADTTISVPANAAVDDARNGNVAMTPVLIAAGSVAETQKAIAGFMLDRANNLLSHQPELIPFLRDQENPGHFRAKLTPGNGSFSYASPKNRILWGELDGSWSTSGGNENQYLFGVLGAHNRISETLLVGGMVQFDHQRTQTKSGATVQGSGYMVGPYFVARDDDQPLFYEGRLLYGQTFNEVSPRGTYTDSFRTDRWLAKFRMSGEYEDGETKYFPFLDASYTTDAQRAYTDAAGRLVGGQSISVGRLEAGFNFSHDVSDELMWTGGASGVWTTTSGTGAAADLVPAFEGGRAELRTGLTYRPDANTTLKGDLRYDGIGQSDYESLGLSLELTTKF